MFFDTHFHLDLFESPQNLALEIEGQKIYTIAVTNLPAVFANTEALCRNLKYIRPALGYHPELAYQHNGQMGLFKELVDLTRYIGEIGLDNKEKSDADYSCQKKIFEEIIDICAAKKDKILTVHSRRSESDVIDIIGRNFPGMVILHWYSGNLANIQRALAAGCYFSVNLPMTRSLTGKRIIENLPIERILLETDGPFTTHQNVPCQPATTSLIASEILKIKNIPLYEFGKNFERIIKSQ